MSGVYDVVFAALSGDATLQGLLGGSSTDKKVYPVMDLSPTALPAVTMAVTSESSDVGHPIDRPVLDLTVMSTASAEECIGIEQRIKSLLHRKRLAYGGTVIHLAKREYAHDDFSPETQEYVRAVRYGLIAQ